MAPSAPQTPNGVDMKRNQPIARITLRDGTLALGYDQAPTTGSCSSCSFSDTASSVDACGEVISRFGCVPIRCRMDIYRRWRTVSKAEYDRYPYLTADWMPPRPPSATPVRTFTYQTAPVDTDLIRVEATSEGRARVAVRQEWRRRHGRPQLMPVEV